MEVGYLLQASLSLFFLSRRIQRSIKRDKTPQRAQRAVIHSFTPRCQTQRACVPPTIHQQDMKLLPFHFSNTCTFIENIITPVYVSGCTFVPFHAVFKRSNCFCVCGDGEPPSRNKRGIMLADTFVNRPSRLAEEHTWIPLKRVKQSWVFLIKSDVLPIWRMSYSQSSSRNIPHTKIKLSKLLQVFVPLRITSKIFLNHKSLTKWGCMSVLERSQKFALFRFRSSRVYFRRVVASFEVSKDAFIHSLPKSR